MTSATANFRILALCASVPGEEAARERLLRELSPLAGWDALLADAETGGLEPLVRAHLMRARVAIPPHVCDRLTARWMLHGHAARVRTAVVDDVLAAMERSGIRPLLLKGCALARLAYDTPVLRPMRDVDMLVRRQDLRRAVAILDGLGFAPAGVPVPARHHHVRARSKVIDGVMVTVELHHQLLQPTPFLSAIRYEDLCGKTQSFDWNGREALAPSREDMLWHVYAHGFATHVTHPVIRLLTVADLVTLTTRWLGQIDWDRMRGTHGRVWRALPFLHDLTPWPPHVLKTLGWSAGHAQGVTRCFTPYASWTLDRCRDVLWPSQWWLSTRYGAARRWHRVWCRAVQHPASLAAFTLQWTRQRWFG